MAGELPGSQLWNLAQPLLVSSRSPALSRGLPGEGRLPPCSPPGPGPKSPRGSHLLTDEAEAPVGPLALIGLPQDGVEGLTACSVVRGRVGRHGKGRDVHLQGGGQRELAGSGVGDQGVEGATPLQARTRG